MWPRRRGRWRVTGRSISSRRLWGAECGGAWELGRRGVHQPRLYGLRLGIAHCIYSHV